VHLLVCELYIYQNARRNNKNYFVLSLTNVNVRNVKFTHISVTSQTSKIWSSVMLKRRRWSGCMRVVYWTGFLWQVRRKHHTSTERHTRCISCRRPLELRWLSAGTRDEASCVSDFTQHSFLFLTRNLVSSSDVSLRLKVHWICN